MSEEPALGTVKTARADELPANPPGAAIDLFLISFLILFFELAAIRWFPAYVVFLTFFTNFVLIAAFVGMGVGCLAARHRVRLDDYFPSLLSVTCALALAVYVVIFVSGWAGISVYRAGREQEVFFGAATPAESSHPVLPIECIIAVFFVLVALLFVGPGQILGRRLAAIENRLLAYTLNIGGSLAGIGAFALISRYAVPPWFWFLVVAIGMSYFLARRGKMSVPNGVLLGGVIVIVGLAGSWRSAGHKFYWSPYYNIYYQPLAQSITVNTIGHQAMAPRRESPIYALPYVLARRADLPPLEDVLVIGAGSGNDVAHALWHGARRVDAVEIDPIIAALGREHPDRPYDDPRVNLTISDGRAVLRNSGRKYDLIVYALVDSLTLQSSYSSIRLESFLFTEESFDDVRSRLEDDGLFVMYNMFREGWIITRLKRLLTQAFGAEPLVLSLPWREEIVDTSRAPQFAVLVAGSAEHLERLRHYLRERGPWSLPARLDDAWQLDAEGGTAATADGSGPDAQQVGLSEVIETRAWRLPSDDWPFLYLRDPGWPRHVWTGLAIVLVGSLGLIGVFAPRSLFRFPASRGRDRRGLSPHFLFLGAGFMLIETRSITRMAVLFGSTWVVNSVVFAAILAVILLANWYVLLVRPRRHGPYYAALGASLALNLMVPLDWFVGTSVLVRLLGSGVLTGLPVLFAGVVFASSFRHSAQPDVDFGANLVGVVLGGILEYLALVMGYQMLLWVALGLYALSLWGRPQWGASAPS